VKWAYDGDNFTR